jgi:hypothetical protein
MTNPHDQVAKLLTEAEELPAGPEKVELYAEAARYADSHSEIGLGVQVRQQLLDAALDGGQPDRMAVAFSWLLARSDALPDLVPPDEILWQYRWVISELSQFPQIPRKQIEDMIADMACRYQSAGMSLRPVHLLRMNTMLMFRDGAGATAALSLFQNAPRDEWCDNSRTEESFTISYLLFLKRDEEAIKRCPQVLAGRCDDAHFFGIESAELLDPLLRLGRLADAIRIQKSGYRYVARKHRYLDSVGSHIEFLALIDNFPAAIKAFEDHAAFALETKMLSDRFDFFRSVTILVGRLRRSGNRSYRFRLPKAFPVANVNRLYDLAELEDWLRADVAALGRKFDLRNGNTWHADQLLGLDELISRPAPSN